MEARKKVFRIRVLPIGSLREKILQQPITSKQREAIIKDFLLLEAALATDQTIISLDDTMRKILKEISANVGQIKDICWVNPDNNEETPLEWVKNGAQPENERKIGYQFVR